MPEEIVSICKAITFIWLKQAQNQQFNVLTITDGEYDKYGLYRHSSLILNLGHFLFNMMKSMFSGEMDLFRLKLCGFRFRSIVVSRLLFYYLISIDKLRFY